MGLSPSSVSEGPHTKTIDNHPQLMGGHQERSTSLGRSLKSRLGLVTLWSFVGSLALQVAGITFISFLWFGTIDNKIWRSIMLREDWITRCISLTSLAVRWAVGVQTTVSLSMLAALALERYIILYKNAAAVSTMRVASLGVGSTIREFYWPLLRRRQYNIPSIFLIFVTTLLLITSTLLQFMSTALLGDLRLTVLPGSTTTQNIPIDYEFTSTQADSSLGSTVGYYDWAGPNDPLAIYQDSLVYWKSLRPLTFPTFAEFSESPYIADNVSDTGTTLRAFLPFKDIQQRESLGRYSGKALIFDARVTCQKPDISQLIFDENVYHAQISGQVRATVNTPRLAAAPDYVPFYCYLSSEVSLGYSLCELNNDRLYIQPDDELVPGREALYSGSLVSEFRDKNTYNSGAAYLLFSNILQNSSEWTHRFWRSNFSNTPDPDSTVSMTLCYAALDTANRQIDAFSSSNRTEPIATWNKSTSFLDYSTLATQLVRGSSKSTAESRNILKMESRSPWVEPLSIQNGTDGPVGDPVAVAEGAIISDSWVLHNLHLKSYGINDTVVDGIIGNFTESFNSGDVDRFAPNEPGSGAPIWLSQLFQYFINNTSTAVALQSVLTIVAEIAYYDRLEQYDKVEEISAAFFVPRLSSGGPFGQKRTEVPMFYTLVSLVLVIHMLLVISILVCFSRKSKLSRVGDPWQVIAHVALSTDMQALATASSIGVDKNSILEDLGHGGMIGEECVTLVEDVYGAISLRHRKQG